MQKGNMPYINSLAGLKAICLLLLFCWHAPIPRVSVDLGARTCEFLFLASGFLVGYNGYYKNIPGTWGESFHYVGRKLAGFWPLHAIAMFAVMFCAVEAILSPKNIIDAVINLALLQAWSAKTQFSFNGASWFLSALIFCYFLTPFLLKLAKKIRTSCVMFVFAFLVRAGVERIMIVFPNEYWFFSVHSFPMIRALEYTLGMMMVPVFIKARDALQGKKHFLCMTLLEAVALSAAVWTAIHFKATWQRSSYLVPFSVLTFVFAFDGGELSRLLACKPFKWFSAIQFEFFILHQAVRKCLLLPYARMVPNLPMLVIALFITDVVLAVGYKKLLEKRLSQHFINTVNHTARFLQIDFQL